ncbi:hypothetical protein [Bradyrhizobium embrapense]|uniref:hypothetical protein n=1 Tax=Bradyrhizobium embrapense TaxID=630921 RepID=UPI000A03E6B0|nr:hypothetical protein [Bradyrhizobium embrapense]
MTHHAVPSVRPCRVLIIEDEYFLGDDLAKALRARGVDVIGPLAELPDAMTIKHDGFDVAVIDINLRNVAAYPLADELIRVGKPFLFATGYDANAIPERFRHVQRLEKPCDVGAVATAVITLCPTEKFTPVEYDLSL